MPEYMMLIYTPVEGGPPPDELAAQSPRWDEYTQGLIDAGLLVAGNQLHGVDAATTVRVRDSETQITDGPFAVTKEYLAGYYLLDCPDLDTALAQASRIPSIHYGSVEVRPIVDRAARAAAANGQAQTQA